MKTGLIIALIIGVILIAGVGGAVFYCSTNKNKTHPQAGIIT